jgi:hypothetical protein
MAWLKLTRTDGTTVHVNMDQVVRFNANTPSGATMLTTAQAKDGASVLIKVREAPEQIAELLRADQEAG